MKGLAILVLIMTPLNVQAEPVRATIEQQAEIITHIQLARHAVDRSQDDAGNPRNGAYADALKKKVAFEVEMGIPLDARGDALRPPTEQELKNLSGGLFGHDRRGEYAQVSKEVQEARQKSTEEYNKALELTAQYYNIVPQPQYRSGLSVSGPLLNKPLAWAPRFSSKPNQDETALSESELEAAFASNPAFIRWDDGAIIFRDAAFLDDSGQPAPGILASVIYHEMLHVQDALIPESPEHDMRNDPKTEVAHRLEQLTDEDTFEYPAYDWKQDFKSLIWQNDLSAIWAAKIAAGLNPYNPIDRVFLNALKISLDRKNQIDAQVEHDVNLMAYTDPVSIESLENLKAEADTAFIKNISDESLHDLVEGWEKALDLDAHADQRREQEAAAEKAQILAEAERQIGYCGFQPRYNADGNLDGFSRDIRGWPATYAISHEMTLDEFKVGLMIADACLNVTMGGVLPENQSTCNYAYSISDEHWDEPGFKADSQFDVLPEQQAMCVNYVHDHWKAPMDRGTLTRLLSNGKKEYEKGVDAAWRESRREKKEEEDADRERRARQGRSGGGGRSGSGGIPDQGHPRAPIHCGFDANGAYCR